jgi:hypothetical protein
MKNYGYLAYRLIIGRNIRLEYYFIKCCRRRSRENTTKQPEAVTKIIERVIQSQHIATALSPHNTFERRHPVARHCYSSYFCG